jgi:hypothetical protein
MQRLLLLFLSISLGVLVFLCSQKDFNLPMLTQDSTKFQMSDLKPFYYAALQIVSSEEELNNIIEKFQKEIQNQNMILSDALLVFKSELGKSDGKAWVIATKIPESFSISHPLYKAQWNWKNVLVWDGSDEGSFGLDSAKLSQYLEEHKLFAIGPVIEIFENPAKLNRKFWLPVSRKVGN